MNAFWWALLTACIWGFVPIMEKFGLNKVEPFVALFYRSLGVILGLLCLVFFVLKPSQIRHVEPKAALILVAAGFMASFLAQIAFYHGLKIGEVSRVTPVSGTYPLIAFMLGVLILGETMTLLKLAGVVLIVTGAWLLR
jgi:bacterial/archaeal transporter family protein